MHKFMKMGTKSQVVKEYFKKFILKFWEYVE